MIRFSIFMLLLLNLSYCNPYKKKNVVHPLDSTNADNVPVNEKIESLDTMIREDLKELESVNVSIDSIRIVIENTRILKDSTYEDKNACRNWRFSESDLRYVLSLSNRISSEDLHHLYYTVPCQINGKIWLNGVLYKLKINGGSYIYLSNSIHKIYLGCSDDKCKKYFLVQGGRPERDGLDQ